MCMPRAWVFKGVMVLSLFAFPLYARAEFGDMDGDGDIELHDYALFRACLMGPSQPVSAECQAARFDADVDVDLREIARFQAVIGPPNNRCSQPIEVGDGNVAFSNDGANTDGPDEPNACLNLNDSHVRSDIWYCYTASCTGTAFVSLCGSEYDTKLAVYAGCGCPAAPPLGCSDDDCGTAASTFQSRVELSVTTGQSYLIRIGGYFGAQGDGRLTIGCNVDSCATATGDCFTASPMHAPGCSDDACCATTCDLDQFCCDVEWDGGCACEAQGVCTSGFPACAPGSGSCGTADHTPGCDNVTCCNTVCSADPYCCCQEWDGDCVTEAQGSCLLTCSPSAEDCFTPHDLSPGCNDVACCEAVCTQDSFCCSTGWDDICVSLANSLCN